MIVKMMEMHPFKEVEYKKYSAKLKVAEELYKKLVGEPKTAKEKADKFNKVGLIIRTILEDEKI